MSCAVVDSAHSRHAQRMGTNGQLGLSSAAALLLRRRPPGDTPASS
jgi:hypothetical protein